MRKFIANLLVGVIAVLSIVGASTVLTPSPTYAAACNNNATFFVLPAWYRGLSQTTSSVNGRDVCLINFTDKTHTWQQSVVTVAINVLDGLIRLAGLLAVVFIILGGIRYITSQGESSGISAAKQTITRAITGLIIAICAVLILNFIAGTIFGLTVDKDNYQVTGGGSS